MNCNYKVKITDIQTKYKFKVFCTGYDDSELKQKIDTMYEAWPKATAEGETVTLDNTANATMSIDLKGNTSQDGTPTPEAPQDIHVVSGDNSINVCGKNLADYDNNTNLENKVLNASGVFENSNYTYINGTIKTSNNKITISFNNRIGDPYIRIGEYKIDGTFIKRTLVTTTPTTLTLDSNTSYIIYSIDKRSGAYFDKLQIEMNDQATTYEEYKGASYPINLGTMELCKIGTYQDYIYKDNKKWYKYGAIGKVVLNGSEGYWTAANNRNGLRYFYRIINGRATDNNIMTDRFTNTQTWSVNTNINGINGSTNNQAINIMLEDTSIDTNTQFQNWLSSNNTTVYYVLATPPTTEITDTTLISQLNALAEAESYSGQTNISQTNDDKPFIITAKALKDLSNL